MKVTESAKGDIVRAYTEELEPMISIAKRYGITRQGIWKVLNKAGIDTSKRLGNTRHEVTCLACKETFIKGRAYIRQHRHVFCSRDCYFAFLEAKQEGSYKYWRHGMRIAREVVSQYFDLQERNVVHHEDRNCYNNHPSNLKVFATNGDHVRYHRWSADGVEIEPLWDGSKI